MMMKSKVSLLLLVLVFNFETSHAQITHKTENIFLITVDGLRWQEVFNGVDSLFVNDPALVEDRGSILDEFWNTDPMERRKLLLPFFWNTIASEGQLYGNRTMGNLVENSNKMLFSYPGYNEILSGFADDERIDSNEKMNNANVTFLEYLNQMPAFQGKVLAYASWDVFPYIINEERSRIPVNAGFDKAEGPDLTEREIMINHFQDEIRGPWGGVRLDPFTHHYAMEGIKKRKPKVVYIAYGEPDDWAHDKKYDQYALSSKQFDAYLEELWDYIQSTDQYKDKTTMIITTDHGRGTTSDNWNGHGSSIPESKEIWMAALGPDTPAIGELKQDGHWYAAMIPRTIFSLLGLEYPDEAAGEVIEEMINK